MKKIPRSIWLPSLLLIYLLGMSGYHAKALIQAGETMRLVVVFLIEILIIVALYFFLRKREKVLAEKKRIETEEESEIYSRYKDSETDRKNKDTGKE